MGKDSAPDMLPNYVHDIATSTCVFCPYGVEVAAGDRVYIYDEKTVYGRQQRERLVEITAVKQFRSTGRVITLDLAMISAEEAAHIAEDSETTVDSMLQHYPGHPTFDAKHPPVVVYFEPCNEDDTTGSRSRPGEALSLNGRPHNTHESRLSRMFGKVMQWGRRGTAH